MNPAIVKQSQKLASGPLRLANPQGTIRRYGLAVVSVFASIIAALILKHLQVRNVEVPVFMFAVATSAWFGGAGPAAVSLLLSCLSFDYFFVEPFHTLYVTTADLPYFLAFASFASLVTWFTTLRKRVESELIHTQQKLRDEVAVRTQQASLLDLTHDTIFVRDMRGIITYWNRGAVEMYGWETTDAIGKASNQLLRTVFPTDASAIQAALLNSGRWDGELENTRADGTKLLVASRWSLRQDENGTPTAILETNNDITARKQWEQDIQHLNEELSKRTVELEATNRELEAFAYSISHDLRAPLRHMVGFASLLQKNAAATLSAKSERYLTMILESAKKMGNLIDDLLGFSRIGRAETHKTSVSLDQLVQEAIGEVRQETEGRAVVWRIDPLPVWFGDRSMLRLVFVNLVSNAVKFTGKRAQAEIEIGCSERKANQVVIYVRDNGVGFDMKYVHKLFGVFQRLHASDAFEGTGIGLATVQRIVHRHGGEIWAEGTVNEGATFFFSLARPQGVY